MKALLLLLAIAQGPSVPGLTLAAGAQAAEASQLAMPPADWSGLPELQYVRRSPDMEALSAFVRDEVNAGRCTAAGRVRSAAVVTLDLAVLVGPSGRIRKIVPRAIDCVTVEQYGSGLVSRLARDNLVTVGLTTPTWFRTTLVFSWPA